MLHQTFNIHTFHIVYYFFGFHICSKTVNLKFVAAMDMTYEVSCIMLLQPYPPHIKQLCSQIENLVLPNACLARK